MSIVTTLRPDTTDDSGGAIDPNAGTGWQCLSDDSDGTYVGCQLSTFEPTKFLQGTWGNLPVGVGRVNSLQARMRAGCNTAASTNLLLQTDIGTGRVSANPIADVITNYASASFSTYTTKPLVDALGWYMQMDFVAHAGAENRVYELYLDVDWNPAISGFKGFMLSVLGPLVAVGLHEMPGIAAELLRRSRTLITPDEYLRLWRELREDRGRRYFALGA